jgi:hypothetical protein
MSGGTDIVCASAPPVAQCWALREHGTRFQALPSPGPIRQVVVAGPPVCAIDTDGQPRCTDNRWTAWHGAETFTWKQRKPAYLFSHESSLYLIDEQGFTTTCDEWEGTMQCGEPRPQKLPGIVREDTSWALDGQGVLWRSYPGEITKLMDDITEPRSGYAYDLIAVDAQGTVWCFADGLDTGTSGTTGVSQQWTRLRMSPSPRGERVP